MDFVIDKTSVSNNVMTLTKASATVIEAWDFVEIASGLAIKATATSANIAYTKTWAAAWDTTIDVVVDPTLILRGVSTTNFAVTNKSAEVDLAVTSGVQLINLAATTTKVLRVIPAEDAGTAGATTDVKVVINKAII